MNKQSLKHKKIFKQAATKKIKNLDKAKQPVLLSH